MAEKKVKYILEKQKKQKPVEIEYVGVKRVWDFKGINETDLESLIEELVRRADIDEIMNNLARELAITGKENNLFWADQITKIIEKQVRQSKQVKD